MSRSKAWTALGLLIVVVMIVSACQPAPAPTPETIIQTIVVEGTPQVVITTQEPTEPPAEPAEPKRVTMYVSNDFAAIDTSTAWDVAGIQIVDTMTVGLTRQNEQTAEMELAMATDYTVSEDGLTYTFTIRDDVPWVRYNGSEVEQVLDCEGNPRMVNAHDFAYGILRTATPSTAADYGYVVGMILQGASDFVDGVTDDPATVGVAALDDQTLEIKFNNAAVYNLNVAGLWFMHAQPQWIIEGDDCTEGRGDRWVETGFSQSYGPYLLKEWIHDAELVLMKNPFWPADEVVPEPKIDELVWRIMPMSAALAEYEAGNLDIADVPAGDYDRIHADPVLSAELLPIPGDGVEFYSFNTQMPPFDDARVRKAFSMAVDREALVATIKNGIPAQWFTLPSASGAPKPEDYPDLGIFSDAEGAKALWEEYLTETGQTVEDFDGNLVLLYNTSESRKLIAETVQQMWADVLGVTVQLTNQETGVFRASRELGQEHIYRSSWVQDYPDANNYLMDVFGPGGSYQNIVDWPLDNSVGETYDNPVYDEFVRLITEAALEQDPAARTELYAQAEQILVGDEAIVAPLYWYASEVLVKPHVEDTISIIGYDRFEKWDISQ
ncbi:MAG TPA: peptide ABC transporter substrate-binding protein [Anaerolineaceae bacterium]|nr:peptide ABC transporter substrate-binding protein [Anaerolineaceae bacterium]